ncbi:MAG: hypothetical protein ABL911_03540 [Gallionella sp.]
MIGIKIGAVPEINTERDTLAFPAHLLEKAGQNTPICGKLLA